MVTGLVRFSFVQVFEAKAMEDGAEPKYSVQILIPKSDKAQIELIMAEIEKAKALGVKSGKLTAGQAKSPNFKIPLRDGDQHYEENPSGAREHCKGHMFFNASSNVKFPPGVVNAQRQVIMDKDELYSGCYGHAAVNFYAFAGKSVGIAAGLNHVMKKKDGDRLDGRTSADEAFADIPVDESDETPGTLE